MHHPALRSSRFSLRLSALQCVDEPVEVRPQLAGGREAHVPRHAHPVAQVGGRGNHRGTVVTGSRGGNLQGGGSFDNRVRSRCMALPLQRWRPHRRQQHKNPENQGAATVPTVAVESQRELDCPTMRMRR